MRAVQVTTLDGPAAVSVQEIPEPTPGDGDVLIRVHRAGVAFPDVLMSRGEYQMKPELPFVPGSEVAGEVVSAPEGSGLTPGQRVAAFPGLGGFGELATAPPSLVFPLPDGMSLDQAASLPMNYLTCIFALQQRGQLQSDETVLVHGASGGIGTAAVQIARSMGARVIACVSTPEKEEVARRAGAHEVVLAEGFKDAVKQLTDGRGVDVVLDPVGGDRFTDSLRSLAVEGRLLVIGFTGGSIPEVKVNRLLLNNISVVGVGWGAFWLSRIEVVQQQWADLMELWSTGGIDPVVSDVHPLDDAAGALTQLDERRAAGKVLLRVAD